MLVWGRGKAGTLLLGARERRAYQQAPRLESACPVYQTVCGSVRWQVAM
ncbi:hypothetical protein NEOLEDRAFT_1114146 [Acetobacter orientalis]|uniref:Uncharacterized protein n=1 Tax=Acetobacter orientalis TaxID=146474 RepID=A0A2Z5ZK57_9PROT|nr:hypothetical protein NEOLEDRAFT_1114146 [Acetobacter orientalis]